MISVVLVSVQMVLFRSKQMLAEVNTCWTPSVFIPGFTDAPRHPSVPTKNVIKLTTHDIAHSVFFVYYIPNRHESLPRGILSASDDSRWTTGRRYTCLFRDLFGCFWLGPESLSRVSGHCAYNLWSLPCRGPPFVKPTLLGGPRCLLDTRVFKFEQTSVSKSGPTVSGVVGCRV